MFKNELNPDLLKAITDVNDQYLLNDAILFRDEYAIIAQLFRSEQDCNVGLNRLIDQELKNSLTESSEAVHEDYYLVWITRNF